jgi:uncharacterized UPF0160 family protein
LWTPKANNDKVENLRFWLVLEGMRAIRSLCTHDGSFHADEALAVFLMKQLYPNVVVTRSRDAAVHEKHDMLVDVGAVFDESRLRFDHHQRGFTETFSSDHKATILSSAGLIYKFFGRDVLAAMGVPSRFCCLTKEREFL